MLKKHWAIVSLTSPPSVLVFTSTETRRLALRVARAYVTSVEGGTAVEEADAGSEPVRLLDCFIGSCRARALRHTVRVVYPYKYSGGTSSLLVFIPFVAFALLAPAPSFPSGISDLGSHSRLFASPPPPPPLKYAPCNFFSRKVQHFFPCQLASYSVYPLYKALSPVDVFQEIKFPVLRRIGPSISINPSSNRG